MNKLGLDITAEIMQRDIKILARKRIDIRGKLFNLIL